MPAWTRTAARGRALAWVTALALLVGLAGADDEAPRGAAPDASLELFGPTARPVPSLRFTVAAGAIESLRGEPRTYVPARLEDSGGPALEDVAVKLKGAAGSFRDVDDRPSLTLDTDRLTKGQLFHGLAKLHLNSSVQDESLLCEALAAELFAAAGLPVPRVTHAHVLLNGRDLGLYVLKEGVDERFLARHFAATTGNLYDGGFCTDIDTEIEHDGGQGPADRSDLAALVAACQEGDLALRLGRVEPLLDLEAFLKLVALERMLGHWDGYAMNRNNYRVYMRPPDARAFFLPHGLDQLFQDPGASVLDEPVGLVADAVLSMPAPRRRYRAALVSLLPLFDASKSLLPRVKRLQARLRPALRALGPEAAQAHAAQVQDLSERLAARETSLREQVQEPDPPGVAFDAKGRARITGWRQAVEEGEPVLEEATRAGRRALGIAAPATGGCVASWRRRLTLPRGRYVLEALAAVDGVVPRADERGRGAGPRISGAERMEGLTGTASWRPTTFEFEVTETLARIELVLELRAEQGRAFFAVESLRLARR